MSDTLLDPSMGNGAIMPEESNKAIVHRFFEEVFNKRNISLVDELVTPNFIDHNASIQMRGVEGVIEKN